jgi:hypothetical protein
MYPSLPTVDVDATGTATLPDGRKVGVHSRGYVEGDTNAFVDEEEHFFWEDGTELSLGEINSEITHEGRSYYLHEYVWEFVKWD